MLGSYPTDDNAHHEAFSLSVPGQLVQRRDVTRVWFYFGGAILAIALALSITALSVAVRKTPAAAVTGGVQWKP
jgi:hypothetical protein